MSPYPQYVAGEEIKRGELVAAGPDGKLYRMSVTGKTGEDIPAGALVRFGRGGWLWRDGLSFMLEHVFGIVAACAPTGATRRDIVRATGLKPMQVSNALMRLKAAKRVRCVGRGLAARVHAIKTPAPARSSAPAAAAASRGEGDGGGRIAPRPAPVASPPAAPPPRLPHVEQDIFRVLARGPATVDELAQKTRYPGNAIRTALVRLVSVGDVARGAGDKYALRGVA